MNDTKSQPASATYVSGLLVVVFSAVALYLTFTEPFAGTSVGYAGRILGPIAMMLIGVSLVTKRRLHRTALGAGAVIGMIALILVIAG